MSTVFLIYTYVCIGLISIIGLCYTTHFALAFFICWQEQFLKFLKNFPETWWGCAHYFRGKKMNAEARDRLRRAIETDHSRSKKGQQCS